MVLLATVSFESGKGNAQTIDAKAKSEKSMRYVLCYGNLTGAGLGMRYVPKRWLGFEILVGAAFSKSPIWATPYVGNTANMMLRAMVSHPWGVYATVGGYAGFFDFSVGLEDYLDPLTKVIAGSVLSLGFEWPKKSRRLRIALETGMVVGLPLNLEYNVIGEVEEYNVTVKRSHPDMGKVFPFFLVQFSI
jgi:hypothetical protein